MTMKLLFVLLLAACGLACEKPIHEARAPALQGHTSGVTRSIAASVGLRYSCPNARRWLSIS